MLTAIVYEDDGTETGKMELPEKLFGREVNEHVIHEAVVAYLANQRQGTASTKERSDVKGGGRKPYRQKGTGRARAGTNRSPIFRGGGTVFGPHPRSYRVSLPRKVKRLALKSALSDRAAAERIAVIDAIDLAEVKTKAVAQLLDKMGISDQRVLILTEDSPPVPLPDADKYDIAAR